MSDQSVNLGGTPSESDIRDALHICCISGIAGELLYRGCPVKLVGGRWFADNRELSVAIVDPYREDAVGVGQVFWVCLKPNTASHVRHVWEHPAFPVTSPSIRREEADAQAEAQKVISGVAEICGLSYGQMLSYANLTYEHEQEGNDTWDNYIYMGEDEGYKAVSNEEWSEFWAAYKTLTNATGKLPEYIPFSCSC